MSVKLILGTQWGDEGKGKIIDAISQDLDIVVRYQGGNNAGHTVINPQGTFKMHLVPSGIFHPKAKVAISNGAVIDIAVLFEEIEMLEKAGVLLKNRLFISPRCHIILPYHKLLDRLYEDAKEEGKIGTTGRGIGPVHADKVSYNGIRISDFIDQKKFIAKLSVQLLLKNKILVALGAKPLSFESIEKVLGVFRERLKPYVKEPYPIIQEAIRTGKNVLMEGAQAVFLDTDWGTYPFVTASTVVAGGVTGGAGVAPSHLTEVIGVVKAYTTRVGSGPFPTELNGKEYEKMQELGQEVGATTGRNRRCGWLDLEMVRFACELNGITNLAITKLDILDTYIEIKVCTGYEYIGKKVRYYDGDEQFLLEVKPVYKTMPGWNSPTQGLTDFDKLPANAKKYLAEIEKISGVKIKYISTGPSREELIIRK
jgi:adenylosuccinate synthase